MAIETTIALALKTSTIFGKLKAFVESELAEVLATVARDEFNAAIRALGDLKSSTSPERELSQVVTCFRLSVERSPRYSRILPEYTHASEFARANIGVGSGVNYPEMNRRVEASKLKVAEVSRLYAETKTTVPRAFEARRNQ